MCWCRPEVRTPECGRIGCHPPMREEPIKIEFATCQDCGTGQIWDMQLHRQACAALQQPERIDPGLLINGVRVHGNKVIVSAIGGNAGARLLCGALIELRTAAREVKK